MKVCEKGLAPIAVCFAVLLSVSGCGQGEPEASQLHFARVSGDVIVVDDEASVNLVIVAPVGDSVWSGIHELVVVNDAVEGGDLVFGAGAVPLHPGTKRDGLQVGSIPVTIPDDVEEFELTTVNLVVDEREDPVSFDVGDWRMERVDPDPTFSIVGDYPASVPQCADVGFEVQRRGGSDAAITGVEAGAPGLAVRDLEVDVDESGVGRVVFSLDCDEAYDFFAFSPTLIVENGPTPEERLDPILVRYLDFTEEDVQRIVSR